MWERAADHGTAVRSGDLLDRTGATTGYDRPGRVETATYGLGVIDRPTPLSASETDRVPRTGNETDVCGVQARGYETWGPGHAG